MQDEGFDDLQAIRKLATGIWSENGSLKTQDFFYLRTTAKRIPGRKHLLNEVYKSLINAAKHNF